MVNGIYPFEEDVGCARLLFAITGCFFCLREVQKMNANTKIALLEARLRKLEVRKQYNSGVQQKIRRQILKLQQQS